MIEPIRPEPARVAVLGAVQDVRVPFDELEVFPDVLERPGIAEELLKVSKVLTNIADEVDDGVMDGAATEAASAGIPMQSTQVKAQDTRKRRACVPYVVLGVGKILRIFV